MVDNHLDLDNVMKISNVYFSGHTMSMYNKLATPDSLCLPIDITHDKTLI